MTLALYGQCFAVGIVGLAIQVAMKIQAFQKTAALANLKLDEKSAKFKWTDYFTKDWLSVVIAFLTLVLYLFVLGEIIGFAPAAGNFIMIGAAFVGYTGGSLASRLFSVIDKRFNDAIDYKTTQADEKNGTADSPTPAK